MLDQVGESMLVCWIEWEVRVIVCQIDWEGRV